MMFFSISTDPATKSQQDFSTGFWITAENELYEEPEFMLLIIITYMIFKV